MINSKLGFTLVEAMVALVIFSMAAMGIYSWINTNLISLNRVVVVAESEFVVNSVIERLKLVDLRNESDGLFDVAGYQVRWRAELVEPWSQGLSPRGTVGIYDLGLYRVVVDLNKGGQVVATYSYRQTAWYQAREPKKNEDDFVP
ncbi:PulJ/GspJ family protein [Cellvibrio sp. OA-2007]|uniref:PulJ/GspJ family protein n=1 Tax=Cellvibrio sp. OA-2007 TaxID=529823 RepID=UPI000783B87E|nr:prepilin-type N-terminal cleavage/methylation domain-containing protein [Cellvibrio sp. OA-2007]